MCSKQYLSVCFFNGCFHGVTLLAFGNGAPDVFSAYSGVQNMKNDDVGLVFGALLGEFSTRYPMLCLCCCLSVKESHEL